MNRGMWLGFIFFVALVILGFGTLIVKGGSPFSKKYAMKIHFPRAQGLKEGSDVRVDGILFGRVDSVILHPQSGVRVVVKVNDKIELYEDSEILVESSSVLGGNIVSIKRGSKGKALDLDQELAGKSRPGLEEVGELVDENRENVRALIANLKDVSEVLKNGQGTFGKLLKSDELHKETVETIKEVRAEVKKVGDTLDTNIKTLTKELTDKLNNAQGPAGRILNDKAMADKLDRIVTNVEETSKNLKEITDSVKKGDGALGKMVNDKEMGEKLKSTIDNVERASESIKNIGVKLETGEGSVGRLLQDDELYEQAQKSLEDIDKFFGRASRAVLEIVTDYNKFPDTKLSLTHVGIRIGPEEDKTLYVGAALMGLDKDGKILFDKQKDNESTSKFKLEAFLAYRAPWLFNHHLTVKGGMMEGKPGGGLEFRWDDWGLFSYPISFNFDIRDAYNSVKREDIDEQIAGPLMRAYVKFPLWIRRDTWYETLISRLQVVGGIDRIHSDPGYFVGVSFDWPDEDIRTIIGLIGAAK